MTSWRPGPDLQRTGQGDQKNKIGFREILRQQFREVVNALTRRSGEPAPKPRRRRREEAGRVFRTASRLLFRRVAQIPAFTQAVRAMFGTLDWLNPWHDFDQAATEADCQSHHTSQNDLFPRP